MAELSKKICLLVCFFVFIFFVSSQPALAVTEDECKAKEGAEEWDAAEQCWNEYFGAKKRTLQNEIASKTVQIELTTHRIVSARQNITQLEEEISQLDVKIFKLDISLDQLSEILITRIAETYKKGQIDPLALLFSSKDFSEFVSRYKYLRVMQLHDRKLMIQMETARTSYADQKTIKEEKQTQLENWKRYLEQEKIDLAQAVEARKILLAETETSYQRTMARIAAEKTKLAGVSIFGKPAEFKQWPEDNNYFNQTDVRWALMLIGGGVYYDPADPSYMWNYGCAVTSMAMVLKNKGAGIDPGSLSQSPIYRADLMAWQDVPGPGGFGGSIEVVGHGYGGTVDWGRIDSNLNADNWVVVYVSSVGHYVVLINKEGDDYKMHDPYFGPNISFNSKYSQGAVDEMIIYTR